MTDSKRGFVLAAAAVLALAAGAGAEGEPGAHDDECRCLMHRDSATGNGFGLGAVVLGFRIQTTF